MSYSLVGCGAGGCFGDDSVPNGLVAAECKDPQKVREMLAAAGYPPPPPSGDAQADANGLMIAMLEFAVDHDFTEDEIKSQSPEVEQRFCAALIAASSQTPPNGQAVANGNGRSWWDEQSTGVKVAIGVGGVALVGGVAYLALR